jgi:acetamidase/formamidase
MPDTYKLIPERKTLHGHFSPQLPAILTIKSGDSVHYSTLEAGWGLEPFQGRSYYQRRKFEGLTELDDGHAMVGPIAIDGAKAGQTLEIEIKAIRPASWGYCLAGGWHNTVNERLGIDKDGIVHPWTLYPDEGIGRNELGHEISLKPFMGVMGMPPPEAGIHSTVPPRIWGGNMDCKELVVGTKLYLPISVDGALFSVGDGHAVQGDGEVSTTAIECPMEHVELAFNVLDDFPLTSPVANTPNGWLAMGFHEDLDEATYIALEAMFALMQRLWNYERLDAIALASLAVDLHITQIVNKVRGVHAMLPHGRIRQISE